MNVLQSTFDNHKNLMATRLLTERAPPYDTGGTYFRIMTGNYDNEQVIEKMKKEYPSIEVFTDVSITGDGSKRGATLLLKNNNGSPNLYKDLVNKKVLKIIKFPESNSRLAKAGTKRFYRLLKSPKVEGYLTTSDIDNSEVCTLGGLECDLDPDNQGVTITVHSDIFYKGGMGGTPEVDKFEEMLYDKKMLTLIGILK